MKSSQGLSFLALVIAAVGRPVRNWRVGKLEVIAIGLFSLAPFRSEAQESTRTNSFPLSLLSLSAEQRESFKSDPPGAPYLEAPYLKYELEEQLVDRFERRAMQLYAIKLHFSRRDNLQIHDEFARNTRGRVERSFTRAIGNALEKAPVMEAIREEPWRDRIFQIFKDAFTDETESIGTLVGDDDPHLEYDVDKPILRKPKWKDRVHLFVRPFSMHPNAGIGFRFDGVRAEFKVYHDDVRFSAYKSITDTWSIYASARMNRFDSGEGSFSVGFQHVVKVFPNIQPGILQYGVSMQKHSLVDRGERFREFVPHGFFAFVYDW